MIKRRVSSFNDSAAPGIQPQEKVQQRIGDTSIVEGAEAVEDDNVDGTVHNFFLQHAQAHIVIETLGQLAVDHLQN